MKKILENLQEKNLYRSLTESDSIDSTTIQRGNKKYISFSCNDFLGLSHHKKIKQAAIKAIEKYGLGARASRYVTGNNGLYTKLEKAIADFKNCEDAMVFSSGYAGAIGVIPALVGEGDLIVADKLIHSSLIDGAKLSQARLMRFLHNDILQARNILVENRAKFKKCIIITETVFSMDGDLGDIEGLLKLAREFDAILISDDAHGLWMKGHERVDGVTNSIQHQSGVTNSIQHRVQHQSSATRSALELGGVCNSAYTFMPSNHIQMGTLSKAIGSLGGYVAADKVTIDYLRNFAKSQIYSTALPPAVLAASLAAIKIISKKNLGKKALENAQYFCELMNLPKPLSAIVVIIIGDNKKVLTIAANIKAKGFLVSAIRPPTVEVEKSRLRLTFSAEHKKSDIKKLVEVLRSPRLPRFARNDFG